MLGPALRCRTQSRYVIHSSEGYLVMTAELALKPSIWSQRAQQYGRPCVVNLSLTEAQLDAWTVKQWEAMLPVLQASRPDHIRRMLDYGCGCGRFTGLLSDYSPACRVIGYDPCRELLDLAPQHECVEYIDLDPVFRYIPYDMTFDVIACIMVFGGLTDAECSQAASGITRLLDYNGILLFAEHTTGGGSSDFWRFRNEQQYRDMFPGVEFTKATEYPVLGPMVSVYIGRRKLKTAGKE